MDINNYSYTPYMLDEDPDMYAHYEDDNGYTTLTCEQWGCNPNKKLWVIYSCTYTGTKEVSETFPCDCTAGWESMKLTYPEAVRLYNDNVPEEAIIPLF